MGRKETGPRPFVRFGQAWKRSIIGPPASRWILQKQRSAIGSSQTRCFSRVLELKDPKKLAAFADVSLALNPR